MPNKQNRENLNKLNEKLQKSKAVYVMDYQKLSSNEANELRKKIRNSDAEVQVTKNTLLKLALEQQNLSGREDLSKNLEGQTATVFVYGDVISPLKALFELSKSIEAIKIKGGIVEGQFADMSKLDMLSKLPSKEVLIGQFVGTLKAPINGIVNVLSGSQRKLVFALSAIAKNKN